MRNAMSTEDPRQTHSFQAEINQLLHLVIHSLYSHPDIFLRELVSNASDALDKLRFRAVTEPQLLEADAALAIRVVPDETAGTLTIEDNGVGMTKEELTKDLGTIARSGSREFLEQMTARGQKDAQLIGQFGVGFYSAYLVAERVEVVSRAAGAAEAFAWSSDAKGTFTVAPAERAGRGTSVVLHLKEDKKEFLGEWKLRELITRYSDYVSHPIKLETIKRGTDGKPTGEKSDEVVNRASALWQRPRSEISDEQYSEFYQHLTHDFEAPLGHTHFKAEGTQQFVGLLYLPKVAPFELQSQAKRGLKLFVKRVLIMEHCEELLPQWLRFVRGVIDSDDLPLNVSRELLQDSAVVRSIKKHVVKKALELLERVAKEKPEDYLAFWASLGTILKEGLALDTEYREKLATLLRYQSSREQGWTSLADYITRMPKEQEAIYYVIGASKVAVASSPHLEELKRRGFEVLYMTDPVDEWAAEGLKEFGGKSLVSAMRAELKLSETDEAKKDKADKVGAVGPMLVRMQEILKDRVSEVRPSDRLTDSPCCLVVPAGGTHAFLEQLLKERGKSVPHSKRILEVNVAHPLVESLRAIHAKDPLSPKLTEWVELLHDQALLSEGGRVEDPNQFARRITTLLGEAARAAVLA